MAEIVDFEVFMQRHWNSLNSRTLEFSRFQLLLPHLEKSVNAAATKFWSCDEGTACAVLNKGNLILGDLEAKSCEKIISEALPEGIRKISGSEINLNYARHCCSQYGMIFSEPFPLYTMMLNRKPLKGIGPGIGRFANESDIELVANWLNCFANEALAHEPALSLSRYREMSIRYISSNNMALWEQEDIPSSVAAIVNTTPEYGAISLVYTPPEKRGLGYAAQVVGMLSGKIADTGRAVCLYVDAKNPASKRCYEKVGFVVTAAHAEILNMEAVV